MNTLNQLAFHIAPVFYKLLAMSITASAVGLLLLLIRRFADEKISPRWKYLLWIVVIAALIIPYRRESERALMPSMNVIENISSRGEEDRRVDTLFSENQRSRDSIQPSAEKLHEKERTEKEFYIKSLLVDVFVPLVWFFGTCFILFWWIVVKIRLEWEIRKKGVASFVDMELLQTCQDTMGVREQAECIVLSEISSPALVGIFRPRILLPYYVSTLGAESLSYILMHELAHFKRKDMWVNLLLLGLRALYWFNPLIWILFHRIREDMELRNDDYVLERIDPSDRKSYARSLVEVLGHAQRIPWMALCMIDGKKNVERRIRMIKLSEVFRKRRKGLTVFGIFLLVLLTACFFTESKPLSSNRNWANNLKAEEVLRLEMVVTSEESNQKYHRFGKAEVGEVVDWIRGFDGDLVSDQLEENETKDDSAYNGESVDFYILTRDRTMHTIRIDRNVFIDGEAYQRQEGFIKACPKEKATAPVPEYFHYGERREAFKGLELYVWKDGEGKSKFILLPATNAIKTEAQIYDEKASTSDLDDVAAELAMEKGGLNLFIMLVNPEDFTKEELDKLLEPLNSYLPNDTAMNTGIYPRVSNIGDSQALPPGIIHLSPEELWKRAFDEMAYSSPRKLQADEIRMINIAFTPLLPRDFSGENHILNPVCHFFSSRYERPEELDFSEFLWYFPGEGMSDEKEEDVRQFELLKKIPDFPFASDKKLSDTISPLRRVSRASVNEVLSYYAGITAEQLINQKNVLYLKEWDSYYVYSSDFGAGYFNCASGEITEDGIQLTSEEGARLRLEYRDGRFLIRSHGGKEATISDVEENGRVKSSFENGTSDLQNDKKIRNPSGFDETVLRYGYRNNLKRAFEGIALNEDRKLKPEEIERINQAWILIFTNTSGQVNTVRNFFSSYYETPEELNFQNFLSGFPAVVLQEDKEEDVRQFEMLKRMPGFADWEISSLEENALSDNKMRIRTVSKDLVDWVLEKYAGITVDEVKNQKGVLYLEEYNSYYVSGDTRVKNFQVDRGEIRGDEIYLYSEESNYELILKVKHENGEFRIRSFKKW